MHSSHLCVDSKLYCLVLVTYENIYQVSKGYFWLIWFINQRTLYYHALSIVHHCHHHWHHPALVSASASVHTSPWHVVRHRNFILGTHMHICPPYMYIKYLMILTCGFKMAAILVFFFDLLSCPHRQSQRLHITYTLVSLIYLHTQMK